MNQIKIITISSINVSKSKIVIREYMKMLKIFERHQH